MTWEVLRRIRWRQNIRGAHARPLERIDAPRPCRSASSGLRNYAALRCLARVRAAFFAACFISSLPLVRTAFIAASCRSALLRLREAERVCFDKAERDTVERDSRSSTSSRAWDRPGDGFFVEPDCPFS